MVNISKAVRDIAKSVERDKALVEYRTKVSNRKTHVFHMSVDGFKSRVYLGISAQRNKRAKVSVRQDERIHASVVEYANKLYSIFSKGLSSSGKFTYAIIGGTPKDFKVRITGDGDIFTHLKRIREDAGIRKVSNTIKNTFRDISTGKNVAFDLSHMTGTTVAEQFATEMLKRYESIPTATIANKEAYERLRIGIKYTPGKQKKQAEVSVEDTFWYLNQSTTEEAYILSLLKKAVGDQVLKLLPELSKGVIQYSLKSLSDVAKKQGAKVSNIALPKSESSKVSRTTKLGKGKTSSSQEYLALTNISLGRQSEGEDRPANWSLLVPEINKRLESKIREYMIAPRLVNRTGTFASSVRVTGVDVSKQGYPSFTADYDRRPYQVFDRTLGAGPWNTPERDPKALITMAVRDIVKSMAVGRFFVKVPPRGLS